MASQITSPNSPTGKDATSFHSRRLTRSEIESLRQDLREAEKVVEDYLIEKKKQRKTG